MDNNIIEWHKYPENKPEEEGRYFLTFLNPENSELWVEGYTYHASDEGVLPENDDYDHYVNVKAWAKYPEPYKGDSFPPDGIWAPYPEEVPDGGTVCLTTYENTRGHRFVRTDTYVDRYFVFDFDLIGGDKVVAWTPYPEPYKEKP